MKFFIVLLAIAAVIAVPVVQIPETKVETPVAEKKVEIPATPVTETKVEAKTETKAEAKVETKTETKAEAKPETEKKLEENVTEKKAETETAPVTVVPPAATKEESKGQALAQVMKAITSFATPLGTEESNLLQEVMSKGTEILAQAEESAKKMHEHPEFQTLLQSDSLFGIQKDGSIDADVATNQLGQLMSLITGTEMNSQEKNLVHELIGGFSNLFAPMISGSDPMQSDLEKLAQQFTKKFDSVQQKLASTPQDKLLEPQTLLSVMTEDNGIDTQLLNDVTQKFMDKISTQFEKVMGAYEKYSEQPQPEQH